MAQDPICGMKVDEKTNLRLKLQDKTYYFCSQHCLSKFAKENNIAVENKEEAACSSCDVKPGPWYKNKLFIISALILTVLVLSYFIEILMPFRVAFLMYMKMIWFAVLIGLALGGVIDYYIPREYISKVLSKPQKRTIFYSVFLGFLMTACSHGILALAIQLYKKGASTSAVVSFLLASPWANITLTVMLLVLFGLKGIFIIVSAIVIALVTGLIFQILEKYNMVETNKNAVHVSDDFSITNDIKRRYSEYRFSGSQVSKDVQGVYQGSLALSNMILWWIIIGIAMSSIAQGYMPNYVFQKYMGPSFLGLLVTLGAATVIEVCSEGSAPLAFEIYRQTGAIGNSFVFLMAGVVTDYTEIGLLWANIGRKTALWLPVIAIPQVIVLGILANYLFK